MENFYKSASIVLFALILEQTALAADIPVELLLENSIPASNKFIESANWPQENEKLSFKSLSIGDYFSLEDNQLVRAYAKEGFDSIPRNNEPFMCELNSLLPLFRCTMHLWNNPKNFPQTLQDMSSAFGDPVKLQFYVLLQRAIGRTEINRKKYGSGRIESITITNSRPSRGFLAKATSYFSEKLNSQPTVRTVYKNPSEVYSKKCIESARRIENKAISDLSLKDKNELKKCEDEATLAILSGETTSGRQTIYTWKTSEGKTNVTISSTESAISFGGGLPQIGSNSVILLIELNMKNAIATWVEDINKIKAEYTAESGNKTKSDF